MKTCSTTLHLRRRFDGCAAIHNDVIAYRAVCIGITSSVMLMVGCAAVVPATAAPDVAQIARPSAAQSPAGEPSPPEPPPTRPAAPPTPSAVSAVPPSPAQKVPAKDAATAALQSRPATAQTPARPALQAPSTPAPAMAESRVIDKRPSAPPLDIKALEARLRDTRAIGVFTKLTLKNQVDDLLDQFRARHQGRGNTPVADLRRSYDLLVMKVLALLQDGDPPLALAIVASRESLWSLLSDPAKFAAQ